LEKEWVVVTKSKITTTNHLVRHDSEVVLSSSKKASKYSGVVVHVLRGSINQVETLLAEVGAEIFVIMENRPLYLRKFRKYSGNIRPNVAYSSCRYGTAAGDIPGYFSWGVSISFDDNAAYLDNQFCTVSGNDGTGVQAYIVDTGVNNPTSLNGRITRDFDYYGGDAWDDYPEQHGTFCAGIVGSTIYGFATNVQIHAVKVLDSTGQGSFASLFAGLQWIALNGEVGVINLSLGSLGDFSSGIADLIQSMIEDGFFFSIAAGNDDVDASLEFPANVEGVLAVGSYDEDMYKSSFSNFGCTVLIWGPGSNIISCIGNGTGTEILSGTSMATAFVTGVAALIQQLYPDFTSTDLVNYLTYVSGKNQLMGLDGENLNQRLRYVVDSSFVTGLPLQNTCPQGGSPNPSSSLNNIGTFEWTLRLLGFIGVIIITKMF
jgi:subtilisin family serine protease